MRSRTHFVTTVTLPASQHQVLLVDSLLKPRMQALKTAAIAVVLVAPACAANACKGDELQGAYGMLLTGTTTISGATAPVAAVVRLVFGGGGAINGTSSVNFNGWYLGNPVTGTVQISTDCRMTMNLQDDSGAWQHFSGTVAEDGRRVDLRQSDPGTGERGVLAKSADPCQSTDYRPNYGFVVSGAGTPLAANTPAGISAKGTVSIDPSGNMTLTQDLHRNGNLVRVASSGTFQLDTDCVAHMELALPIDNSPTDVALKLRGILVLSGTEILAIHTDPNLTLSARFTAR